MQPSPELREVFLRYVAALATGDIATVDALFSREPGVAAIGTDPSEWWQGHDAIIGGLRAIFEAVGGGLPFRANAPQAFADGDAGWAYDQPVVAAPDGSTPDFRMSMALRREDGDWKIFLLHASLAVPVGG